ncbi:MAG: DUF4178 domain-containing protein [Myxococcales bacterium]|jgi:hypothetical protein
MSTALNVKTAQCPGCGVTLEFKVGSARVVVCDYCNFAVARSDRGLEDLGKVADIVPTGTHLALGATGRYEGVAFTVVGRLQLEWKQGIWDEWYISLADGRWGWLAEAGGRYYISFRVARRPAPPFATLRPGRSVFLAGYGRLVATDAREARYVAAKGQLPERIAPGDTVRAADLSGPGGLFATLDYSDGDVPNIFVGKEVRLDALEISTEHLPAGPRQKIKVDKLVCPQCNAPVELQVPDESLRVTCRHCNALLDTTEGALRYLATMPKRNPRWLHKRCRFFGVEYLAIGWLERECTVDGHIYSWEEYLLYEERTASYRFLVCSEGHWSFVTPLAAGDVEEQVTGARYNGNLFKPFSQVEARVSMVLGEFYWAVQKGEKADCTDYIRPPEGVSVERTPEEVNWSHAVYQTPAEVWAAFGSKEHPPEPNGVGAMQPCALDAEVDRSLKWGMLSFGIAFLMLLFFLVRADDKIVFQGQFPSGAAIAGRGSGAGLHVPSAAEPWSGAIDVTEPFVIESGYRNLEISIDSNVQQGWCAISGVLINETTNEMIELGTLESSYYSGYDWTEDLSKRMTYVSSVPPGRYVMRVESIWEPNKPPPTIRLIATSGVPRLLHFVLVLVPIVAFPGIAMYRRHLFEQERWNESNLVDDYSDDD